MFFEIVVSRKIHNIFHNIFQQSRERVAELKMKLFREDLFNSDLTSNTCEMNNHLYSSILNDYSEQTRKFKHRIRLVNSDSSSKFHCLIRFY